MLRNRRLFFHRRFRLLQLPFPPSGKKFARPICKNMKRISWTTQQVDPNRPVALGVTVGCMDR